MADRLDTIEIFVAVAEHGSFAEAARRLHKTPAAVTRAVAALEEQLHTRLLNRTTRSVALTDEGTRYLEVCRRLMAVNDELEGLESRDETQPRGRLNVTTPTAFGRLHVLPSITRFLDRFPLIDMRVQMMDRPLSLIDEGQDVGVRLGHLSDSSLRAVRVGQVHLAVFASPDYLARRGTPKTPQDLRHHSTISCAPISPIADRWSFDGAKGIGAVPVHPRLIVSSAEAAADAAASGLGITHIICYLAAECVAAGSLVRILTEYEPPPIPIHVVHPAGNFVPAKVRLFVDHLAHDLRLRFAHN